MAKLLKLRRGTTTQHGSFTGAEGEVTVDLDKDTIVVHDGSTAGGHPVAAEDLANVPSATITGRLSTGAIVKAKLEADIIDGTKLADDAVDSEHVAAGAIDLEHMSSESVDEDNLKVSNTPTNGQYLQAQSGASGGLTWSTVSQTPEGTSVLSTGESGGTKFLREDGDNSCSWQPIPVPTSITVADESIDTVCNVLFTTAATGNLAPKTGTNLTFNSSTGELTASSFVGDVTGNVTGNLAGNATSASTGTTVTVTANESSDELLYLAMVDGTSGSQSIEADSSLQYNPSTGVITTTGFAGNLTGNVTGNTSGSSGSCTGNAAGLTGSPNITVGTIGCGNITGTGTVSDSKGDLRKIPLNTQANAYILVASDAGKVVYTGGNFTINNNVFAAGDAITIINSSNSDITSAGTIDYLWNSADGTTGVRTLAKKGICTIYFQAHNTCFISGAGLS